MVVAVIEGAIKTCGDDKQIVKTAQEEGLYLASTPADANDPAAKAKAAEDPKAVTAANWWFKPYNRLGYRSLEKLVPRAAALRSVVHRPRPVVADAFLEKCFGTRMWCAASAALRSVANSAMY